MTFEDYQDRAAETALPKIKHNTDYMIHGLCNEAGEVAGKRKKFLRGDTKITEYKEAMAYELGDVMWYIANAARVLGYPLEMICQMNIDKLDSRKERGKLQGDGDSR